MSNFISIEAVLDDLLKSDESEKLDEDYKYEDEEEQEEKDEQEKEEPTDKVEEKEEDTEEQDEEKSEEKEQEEEQDEDKEEEPEQDEEDDSKEVMSVNEATDVLYDKLMPRILEAVKEMLDEEKEDKEDEDVTRVVRKAVEAISDLGGRLELLEENIEDLKKSEDTEKILELENKLDKAMSIKKSVGDMRVFNRFDESKELSKAEKAEILANEMEAGNRRVSINDVTNAELGYPLSQAAEEIIKKYR